MTSPQSLRKPAAKAQPLRLPADQLDYSGYASGVEGLGPGRRVALWVRGCGIGCKGCMTPELWDAGAARPVAGLAAELAPLLEKCDGLTISGGEPFDQAAGLTALIDGLRGMQDVEVMCYTGYTLEFLLRRSGADGIATRELLRRLDLLMDGPFIETQTNTLQWRGSDNQRLHLLSDRAQRYGEFVEGQMPERRTLQLQMIDTARYRIIGIPKRGDLDAYRAAMAARGLTVQPTGQDT